ANRPGYGWSPPDRACPVQPRAPHARWSAEPARGRPERTPARASCSSLRSPPRGRQRTTPDRKREMKRIAICCDGTWNRADQEENGTPCPTNVVKLAYRIAKRDDDGNPQIAYYGQGVGTGNTLDRVTGGAFGHGLEDNILDAYRFLIGNYESGDQLYLFGFSRGAFTARSLAGMIR